MGQNNIFSDTEEFFFFLSDIYVSVKYKGQNNILSDTENFFLFQIYLCLLEIWDKTIYFLGI